MSDINNFLQQHSPQFNAGRLLFTDLATNPFEQFNAWFAEAVSAKANEPNAMNLATVDTNGQPSSRIVLLKSVDYDGFVFFTNYNSRKANQIAQNPNAALNFFWVELARQVRVEGILKKVSDSESETYFHSRPRLSQLGAIASAQSEVIDSNENLDQRVEALEKKYLNQVIPRPQHWGGYVLVPSSIEFWQGRPNRLHDRFQYRFSNEGKWLIERLSPYWLMGNLVI